MKPVTFTSPDTITQFMVSARDASLQWRSTSLKKRTELLKKFKRILLDSEKRVVDTICEETYKVPCEALNNEILPVLEAISYYQKHTPAILKIEQRKTPLLFGGGKSYVEYQPHGVVALFSPWNYPFQLATIPALTAMTAGNAVILKSSELTPKSVEILKELLSNTGYPENLLQIIHGDQAVGKALIDAKPDYIFFTGSTATGKKIMEAASKNLIPLSVELGGKDPMIVFDDVHMERAIEGAIFGAFCNAGQLCVSVERLYVQKSIFKEFLEKLISQTKELKIGTTIEHDVGAITSPQQIEIIHKQYEDAIKKGAAAYPTWKHMDQTVWPIILTDITDDMLIMQQETFGPLLPVIPFETEEEAIKLANNSPYGLNASIWSRNLKRAKSVATQLETGNCAINDTCKNIGNPFLPFGGIKESGFGRYHGPEGLRTFSRSKSILVKKDSSNKERNWFPYSTKLYQTVKTILHLLHR